MLTSNFLFIVLWEFSFLAVVQTFEKTNNNFNVKQSKSRANFVASQKNYTAKQNYLVEKIIYNKIKFEMFVS